MKLFYNPSSSAASRVRIALALKGMDVEQQSVGIFGSDAESRQATYRDINPQGLVPALLLDNGTLITQSLAIIEYLDEKDPSRPLLPSSVEDRAQSRAIALAIAAETHALLPPRVALYLQSSFGIEAGKISSWARHWITEGLTAVEMLLTRQPTERYAIGNYPTIADIFIYPQVIGAMRLGVEVDQWPRLTEVFSLLQEIPEFIENAPTPRT